MPRSRGSTIGADVLSLADLRPAAAGPVAAGIAPARSFPAVGLASFHTALGDKDNDISFLMRSSPYGGVSHGHADQNAYVIEAFGRGLAIATGYYPWYGSPHHDQWTRATKAVNSVLVDGQGQVQRQSGRQAAELTAFVRTGGRLRLCRGRGGPGLRGSSGAIPPPRGPRAPGRLCPVRRPACRRSRPGSSGCCTPTAKSQVERDRSACCGSRTIPAAMNVHLLLPDEVEFTQTDQYEPEPESIARQWENTWHLTAGTTAPARGTQFLAVMLVHREGQESTLPKVELVRGTGAVGVRLTARDGAGGHRRLPHGSTTCGGRLRRHRKRRPRVRSGEGQRRTPDFEA